MSGSGRFNPLLVKSLTVAVLTVLLLIPLGRVESLISERVGLRNQAVTRVADGVGGTQTIGAVMLVIPEERNSSVEGWPEHDKRFYRVLATAVDIDGKVDTETRHSGIYRVPTFRAQLHIEGSINEPVSDIAAAEPGIVKRLGTASLFLALSDPGGIRELDGIRVDGKMLPITAASVAGLRGVSVELPGWDPAFAPHMAFTVDLVVSGTQRLEFLPFAGATHVSLASTWPNPSFAGAFSPDASPRVDPQGFAADWRVLKINRDYPQRWIDDAVTPIQVSKSAFGVDFYQPVDAYQCDYRAIHYAILFIVLTFMALFLWEHIAGPKIHAIQYAMTGAALAVFYLVLVAFSEHISFAASYALAAGAMSSLLGVYFSGVRKSRRAGLATGASIGVCYSLLYLLVLSEEYALLLGAIAVFCLLAAIMVGTRALDWHKIAAASRESA